jgi:methionine-rich copper-binding protein CopC
MTRPPSLLLIARGARFLLALALVLVAMGRTTGVASAHAQVIQSDPPAGAALAAAPATLTLWYSEAADPNNSGVTLLDSQRNAVATMDFSWALSVQPQQATFPLPALAPDIYTVVWNSTSAEDGHQATGYFTFAVGYAGSPAASPVALGSQQLGDLTVSLAMSPDSVGWNGFDINVWDSSGQPFANAQRVVLRLVPQGTGAQEREYIATNAGGGDYQVDPQLLGMSGPWQATVIVRRFNGDDVRGAFAFSLF